MEWIVGTGGDLSDWTALTDVLEDDYAAEQRWLDGDDAPSEPLPQPPKSVEVPAVALALSRAEAAHSLRISVDSLDRHVIPHIRVMQLGGRQIIPVDELQAFVTAKAARALRHG